MVEFRKSLTNSQRFTFPVIADQALTKLGIISAEESPTDSMLEQVYDMILDLTLQIVDSGRLGSFKSRMIRPDMKGTTLHAKPWDHIIIPFNNSQEGEGDIDVQTPLHFMDSKGVRRFPKDGDCIKITDQNTDSVMFLVYDSNLTKWCNINEPIFAVDSVPFAKMDREGYIAELMIMLAPYYAVPDSEITQTTQDSAQRFRTVLETRSRDSRDGEQSFLFGTIQDEYHPMFGYPNNWDYHGPNGW